MTIEQLNMFGGSKPVKKERKPKPVQLDMFSQREIAQFGVTARPVSDDRVTLVLISEDTRTSEQIEHDRLMAAREQTIYLDDMIAIEKKIQDERAFWRSYQPYIKR